MLEAKAANNILRPDRRLSTARYLGGVGWFSAGVHMLRSLLLSVVTT